MLDWSNIFRFLIIGNKISAFLALWLVVDFSMSNQGEAAALMVAAMLCNVMLILKLEELRKELR